jgi:hypothetical protein
MKSVAYLLMLVALLGCNAKQPSPATPSSDPGGHVRAGSADIYKTKPPVEGEQAPTWTDVPEDEIPPGCNQFERCRAYTIVSYDDTWSNAEGNEGLFVLRFKNVRITAFCGAKPGSCYQFVEAVGQTIWLDDEETDLIYYRSARKPQRDDAVLVITKRQMVGEPVPAK